MVQITLGQVAFWGLIFIVEWWLKPQELFRGASQLLKGANYQVNSVCLLCSMLVEAVRSGQPNRADRRAGWVQAHFITVQQSSFIILVFLVLLLIAKENDLSRAFFLVYFAVLYGILLITNRSVPRWLSSLLFKGRRSERALVIRSAAIWENMEEWLNLQLHLGLEVVKSIPWNSTGPEKNAMEHLKADIEAMEIFHILLLGIPDDRKWLGEVARFANNHGIRLLIVNDLHERIGHSIATFNCDGVQLITLRQEPLESPFNRLLKRTCDLLISLPVVVFVLPVLTALIWLVQRFQSPGPIFYRQMRSGMSNQNFVIYKFRTMYWKHKDDTRQATNNDDRVYPLGRWIRRLSLDEMPQFLNVLQGSMSVIGPRPHMVEHNEEFEQILDSYNVRTFIRPGITGLAQVRGQRGEVLDRGDIERRLRSDVYYLENWTLGLDLLILARTIACVFAPPKSAV